MAGFFFIAVLISGGLSLLCYQGFNIPRNRTVRVRCISCEWNGPSNELKSGENYIPKFDFVCPKCARPDIERDIENVFLMRMLLVLLSFFSTIFGLMLALLIFYLIMQAIVAPMG